MAASSRQKRITGRVMHEFKHGELKRGRGARSGKVKKRRQAIAIALREAGASRYASKRRNRRNLRPMAPLMCRRFIVEIAGTDGLKSYCPA